MYELCMNAFGRPSLHYVPVQVVMGEARPQHGDHQHWGKSSLVVLGELEMGLRSPGVGVGRLDHRSHSLFLLL